MAARNNGGSRRDSTEFWLGKSTDPDHNPFKPNEGGSKAESSCKPGGSMPVKSNNSAVVVPERSLHSEVSEACAKRVRSVCEAERAKRYRKLPRDGLQIVKWKPLPARDWERRGIGTE